VIKDHTHTLSYLRDAAKTYICTECDYRATKAELQGRAAAIEAGAYATAEIRRIVKEELANAQLDS